MADTPLQEALHSRPGRATASLAEYRGVTTAASFGDPQAEFGALLKGCGVFDLGFRARLVITGSDRVRWLNGMVTNNIRDLATGHGVYAFLLNPQGRILGDMLVFKQGEALVVETDQNQIEKVAATFDHYIIMDDVEIANAGGQWTALGVAGRKCRAMLHAVGIKCPELEPLQRIAVHCDCECECVECTVVRGDDVGPESYEIWLAPNDAYKTWCALLSAGATAVGSEALEMRRIAFGMPLYGVDIRERDLPQETEQMRALNFNKGCYVGQEIVERIRSRGQVHRKFTGFMADATAGISPGAKINAAGKEVGEITSVAILPTPVDLHTIALGYIRREVGTPGSVVGIGGVDATVVQLPLESVFFARAESAMLHKV